MTVVIDASCVVALLGSTGEYSDWAAEAVDGHLLCAPHTLLPEAANALRNHVLTGELSSDAATLAHADLVDFPVRYWSYRALAERVWALRHSVTAYDATYVALAEHLQVPLATLDLRLARSQAPRCTFLTPGQG
jgi:predicted nucleic acid-binding protein